jgi:hypothetical protein
MIFDCDRKNFGPVIAKSQQTADQLDRRVSDLNPEL